MSKYLVIMALATGLLMSGCEKSNTEKPQVKNEPQANVPGGIFPNK